MSQSSQISDSIFGNTSRKKGQGVLAPDFVYIWGHKIFVHLHFVCAQCVVPVCGQERMDIVILNPSPDCWEGNLHLNVHSPYQKNEKKRIWRMFILYIKSNILPLCSSLVLLIHFIPCYSNVSILTGWYGGYCRRYDSPRLVGEVGEAMMCVIGDMPALTIPDSNYS